MARNDNNKETKFDPTTVEYVDYKDTDMLLRFVNEQGKILPRRISNVPAKFQRQLTRAVKRARHLALIPFVNETVR
ncbi:MAG: 30S ribosomal protein S18 [Bacteroidota bacterium]